LTFFATVFPRQSDQDPLAVELEDFFLQGLLSARFLALDTYSAFDYFLFYGAWHSARLFHDALPHSGHEPSQYAFRAGIAFAHIHWRLFMDYDAGEKRIFTPFFQSIGINLPPIYGFSVLCSRIRFNIILLYRS
jgi:hypothetical protein